MLPVFAQYASAETPFPDAEKKSSLAMQVQPFDADDARVEVLELSGYEESPFCLFLPAGCDREQLRVAFQGDSLTVNGRAVRSGEPTDVFAEDGVYTVETPQGTYPLRVLSSENLPSLYIETDSGALDAIHADKTRKEPGRLTVAENGEITLNGAALSYVKGRGNSSWRSNEKRSYTIKFEEDAGLLGMKAAKKWVLTSNNMDPTLMRNAIAYSAARLTRLPYTVDFAFVDLYVNGCYRGNYLLCEKIEVGGNRVAITDLEAANEEANPGVVLSEAKRMQNDKKTPTRVWCDIANEPENITGGYLLEYEYRDALTDEKSGFVTDSGVSLILHSPKHATQGEINYIADLYGELEEALLSEDGTNQQGKHYSDYIDMDSFVDGLLLYDFTANQDRGFTSWYLYLPQDSQTFYMGPLWDFDQSMETPSLPPDSVNISAQALYENSHQRGSPQEQSFIELFFLHREFIDRMTERFAGFKEVLADSLNAETAALSEEIRASAAMDSVRWGYTVDQKKDVELPDYVNARIETLTAVYGDMDAHIEEACQTLERNGLPDESGQTGNRTAVFLSLTAAALLIAAIGFILIRRKKRQRKSR